MTPPAYFFLQLVQSCPSYLGSPNDSARGFDDDHNAHRKTAIHTAEPRTSPPKPRSPDRRL
jgi:hypothetical protein